MFRKKLCVSSAHVVSNKDRKKLKTAILERFKIQENDFVTIFPSKEEITSVKLNDRTIVYSVRDSPMFFDVQARQDLIPTVYALWLVPHLIPSLPVHSPVSKFILGGADFMWPGLAVQLSALGQFVAGDLRGVVVPGNSAAFAVGRLLCGTADAVRQQGKGKALEVLHTYHDELWDLGSKQVPEGFFPHRVYATTALQRAGTTGLDTDSGGSMSGEDENPTDRTGEEEEEKEEKEEEEEEAVVVSQEDESRDKPSSRDTPPALTLEEMDKLLIGCFFEAIKNRITDDSLPMDASALYSYHMLDSRPPLVYLDIKRSSFKKLSKFLQAMQKRKLIQYKDVRGSLSVVSINRQHPEYKAYAVTNRSGANQHAKTVDTGSETVESVLSQEVLVWDMYKPLPGAAAVFAAVGRRPTKESAGLVTAVEVREVISEYIRSQTIPHPTDRRMVILDPVLADALFPSSGSSCPTEVTKEAATKLFFEKMQPFHVIKPFHSHPTDPPIIRKGAAPVVEVVVDNRRGKFKYTTRILGLDVFGIDAEELSQKCQRVYASSATVQESASKHGNVHAKEVMVQGNVGEEVCDMIFVDYKLPKKYIIYVDKINKGK